MKLDSPNQSEALYGVPRWALWIAIGLSAALTMAAFANYPGEKWIYLLFSIISNALVFFGARSRAVFFDTFIGLFMWLGFWLKISARLVFFGGGFYESVGAFDGSGHEFDQALIATSAAFTGLLLASWVRERWFFTYQQMQPKVVQHGLQKFYQNHRALALWFYAFLVLGIGVSNIIWGFYQRGAIPRNVLPMGLSGVYTWLLLFGLASFSSVILHLEMRLSGKVIPIVGLAFFECFVTSVSLLSRGMILNGTALLCGVYASARALRIRQTVWLWMVILAVFGSLFVASVLAVNHLRSAEDPGTLATTVNLHVIRTSTSSLFLDRWVGMEGMLAVTSSPDKGWDLWSRAWKETYGRNLGFYDANLIESQYIHSDLTKARPVSLPGIIAFFYYPGSIPFLFASMFLLGLVGSAIEWIVFKVGGQNLILCSLLAQVVASRYAHFGYLPKQSYLLFGTLFLNLGIIWAMNWLLSRWYASKDGEKS